MESDLSKKGRKNLKREFMDVYIEVDDDVQIDDVNQLSLKCEHTDPRGLNLIFELNGEKLHAEELPWSFRTMTSWKEMLVVCNIGALPL